MRLGENLRLDSTDGLVASGLRQPFADSAGRICPNDYRYSPAVFDRAPDICADVIYVVGGLYGNLAALDAIERLVTAEHGPATVVFNGDFHWFDADPEWFAAVDRRVAIHIGDARQCRDRDRAHVRYRRRMRLRLSRGSRRRHRATLQRDSDRAARRLCPGDGR